MTTFIAVSNSTIYDVCLNTYGSLDLLVKLMVDSGHDGVDTYPVLGQEFIYDETLVGSVSVRNNSGTQTQSGINIRKFATQPLNS